MAVATAIKTALERGGYDPKEVALNVAIAKYQNNGGTLERLIELARAAYELPGEANKGSPQGQSYSASSRQQNGDAGHIVPVAEAKRCLPASPSNRDGKGRSIFAEPRHSPSVRPVREPSVAHITAMKAVRKEAAIVTLTVLDTWKVRDGRSLGDVTFGELENLRFENAREASIIRQIQRHVIADPSAKVRDVVKLDDLQRMIQKAAEVADAA